MRLLAGCIPMSSVTEVLLDGVKLKDVVELDTTENWAKTYESGTEELVLREGKVTVQYGEGWDEDKLKKFLGQDTVHVSSSTEVIL